MHTDKKLVSVVVPIYNEVQMVVEIYNRVDNVFKNIGKYNYELVFFDDGSFDGTREAIENLVIEHSNVKGVFYSRNFGYLKSTFYSMQQAKGDCAVILHADLQNPPEVIPEFIDKWEKGAHVVLGVKNKSRENRFVYFLRTVFYFIMIRFFGLELTPHATEFELFDKSFIEILRGIHTPIPFLRGIVSEYSSKKDVVFYTQDARKKGKSKFNLNKYYDFAICGIVQYSAKIPRKCILLNLIGIIGSLFELLFLFLPEIQNLSVIEISNGILLRVIVLILLALFIFFAVVFEYVIFVAKNVGDKPIIVEEKRINY